MIAVPKTRSIRSLVLRSLLIAGLLPLVAVSIFTYTFMRRATVESEYDKMEEVAREVGREIESFMNRTAQDLRVIASNPAVTSPASNSAERDRELRELHSFYNDLSDITLYARNGSVLASTSHGYMENLNRTEWFANAELGDLVATPPRKILGLKGLYISFYYPVRDATGRVTSVVTAQMPFSQLSNVLEQVRLGQRGFVVLVDFFGNILSHPDQARILQKFEVCGDIDSSLLLTRGTTTLDKRGKFLFTKQAVNPTRANLPRSWTLISLKPYDEVLALLNRQQLIQGGVAGFALILIYVLGVVFSRNLSRPITEAADVAEKVTSGDLAVEVPLTRTREIQKLAIAFNDMVREVRDHRTRLETEVEQHTDKLAESGDRLHRIRAYLEAAYDSMREALLIVDITDGVVFAANQRTSEFFGIGPHDLEGRDYTDIGTELAQLFDSPDVFSEIWRRYEMHPGDSDTFEWEMVEPVSRVISAFTAPVTDRDQHVVARLWVFRDLTHQRALEEELRKVQKMQTIGTLAGGIAHDFNNLLTPILGYTSLTLNALPEGSRGREELKHVVKAAKRAKEVIRQILLFSSQKTTGSRRNISVHPIVEETLKLIERSISPNIEIRQDIDEKCGHVFANSAQLHQVIMNLCTNAYQALRTGGGIIKVSLMSIDVSQSLRDKHPRLTNERYIRLSVEDNGRGIDDVTIKRVLEPFFTTKAVGEGTGLGLAVVHGIVTNHDGELVIESELGKGTVFHVYIPVSAAEVSDDVSAIEVGQGGRGSESIMFVDDEDDVVAVVRSILESIGYTVTALNDSCQALDKFALAPDSYDLVISDQSMPRMTGTQLAKKMREIRFDIPIIIVSGYNDSISAENFRDFAVNDYIEKPLDPDDFGNAIRTVLDETARERG